LFTYNSTAFDKKLNKLFPCDQEEVKLKILCGIRIISKHIGQMNELFQLLHIYVSPWEGTDCIHLAEDREQWCALVRMVMNYGVP
jgi:hypothetical protein